MTPPGEPNHLYPLYKSVEEPSSAGLRLRLLPLAYFELGAATDFPIAGHVDDDPGAIAHASAWHKTAPEACLSISSK